MAVPRRSVLRIVALTLAMFLSLPAATRAAELTDVFAADPLMAEAPPEGFEDTLVWGGAALTDPTQLRFAPDGRVFVAQKDGRLMVFDSLSDPTPSVYADLRATVHNFWDRGMLGMTLDPGFSNGRPYVYVLYTHDAAIGARSPTWGDACPTPPGATGDGCVVSGRLSKISPTGAEEVLIEDWCQQYPSHSVGGLAFGADGALYATGGDGASFIFTDYGQDGAPVNPCGDPPGGVGEAMTAPTAEGGALRSQDLRTTTDPAGLDGAVIRVHPDTGAAMPDNPNAASSDVNARRVIAHGLRNPFRFAFRPGTNDLYIGDAGWNAWEEIDRLPSPAAPVENFGWPCYEGVGRTPSYDNLDLDVCEDLYEQGANAVSAPLYAWHRASKVSTETCPTGGSSASALGFYDGGTFPSAYNGALFWADYSRSCVWVMFPGAGGVPDPETRRPFLAGVGVLDIQVGPGGDLFYVDYDTDAVRRVHAIDPNRNPVARAVASPTSGAAPLSVAFDGAGSTDPDGDPLTYTWDFDGDGAPDSTAAQASHTFATDGNYTARLRVTDPGGLSATTTIAITVGHPPRATIDTPTATLTWRVGDVVEFSGHATGAGGDPLPASALRWDLVLNHCSALDASSCHEHTVQSYTGASGAFAAPDHEYPSHLELVLTATEGDLRDTDRRRLDPRTVDLTFETEPTGLSLSVGSGERVARFTQTVIQGSTVSVAAPTPQSSGGRTYEFSSWSDGGDRAHELTAPAGAATYRATFAEARCAPTSGLVGAWGLDEPSGTTASDASGRGNTGTVSGAERTTAGRFGGALSFDGVDDMVSVSDDDSLDLSAGATLEAWVNPTADSEWRTVLLKEQPGHLVYALYSNNGGDRPSGHVHVNGADVWVNGDMRLPVDTWTHLSMTWDGTIQRLYVNGAEVGSRTVAGTLPNSAGAVRMGGNTVWSEWFSGRLDELRLYDRALTAAEIRADMATPVTCGGPAPPELALSSAAVSFSTGQGGTDPAPQTVDVTNSGGGTLRFDVSESADWLSATPATGSAPGTLTLQASAAGLGAGVYRAPVTVTAAGASGSPGTIDVTLTVTQPPALDVSPASLSFSGAQGSADPASQSLAITNTGGGDLRFSTSDDQPWLSVTPATGDAPGTATVAVSTAGLEAGTYSGQVTVTAAGAAGSPKTTPVSLEVTSPIPVLSSSPERLTFSATQGAAGPVARSLTITNTGGGWLGYTVTDDQAWLSVTPTSGVAPSSVSVSVDATGLPVGVYTGAVTVTSAGASESPKVTPVTLTVAPPSDGLVGAWGFDESSGATATDRSGRANTGTISGATRSTAGRYGGALSFDGVDDWVTIADSASLDLTTGVTLEAWVRPTSTTGWRTVVLKQQPGQLIYALYSNNTGNRPSGHLYLRGRDEDLTGPRLPVNAWTHLAMTWDGTTHRLFINGEQVATRALTGTLPNSGGPLRFGGNSVWPEWFAGRLDEIRIYARALTPAQIQADMATPVTPAS